MMTAKQQIPANDQYIDAYHVTLTGEVDDVVREELCRLCRFETSDHLTYRISHGELMRLRTAVVQRLAEEVPHQQGAFWTERHILVHTPTDAEGYFDETTRD